MLYNGQKAGKLVKEEDMTNTNQNNNELADLHNKVVELLNHLEDVLDDENFDKIDCSLWNAVSMYMVIRKNNMYAIQWYDDHNNTWLLCSTKGQLEIYHEFHRAHESCEKWCQSSKNNGCTDQYRIVTVIVKEETQHG
jgi:hypothetical protein